MLKNKEDMELINLIKNSYNTLRVVGRGTIIIDPTEVSNTKEFKEALTKASELIR